MTGREYSIIETLSEASEATLLRAVRSADGRAVLLKVPSGERPGEIERLRNEHALRAVLQGLPAVEPLALRTYGGRLALEAADFGGRTLEELARGPMELGRFLEIAVRVAASLAAIHGRGLVHKDVKPANVLVEPSTCEVRLTGFGIASRVGREAMTARPARLIEGSLPYVSPEQTGRMNRALDSRSDLYSLGVMFFQLLTAHLPFEAGDAVGWVHAHVARRPPSPDELRPSVPRALAEIVLKLLAKSPDERYQSASGLEHDLRRCLEQWQRDGRIVPFPLGERDLSERFLIPQRLYGRERETRALRDTLDSVASTGEPELVVVTGYSGIGKSAVVHELHRWLVARRGLFVSGKFERLRREVPYSTIVQGFRELVLDILAESPERVSEWRDRLLAALGANAALVVDLIPQLGLILGPQPQVPPLGARESEMRLQAVMGQFFGAFTRREQPLTVFLDDLQWADDASLRLVGHLMTSPETHDLLLVVAYRDNEVDSHHPLVATLEQVRASTTPVRSIVLAPLGAEHVTELVADTLHCSRAEAAPLARLVRSKTGGNPFFTIQFLTALHREGAVAFDPGSRRWRWDVSQIAAKEHSDNVVELMVGKLRKLPGETQDVLRVAACMGVSERASTLAVVVERDPEVALLPALEEDLLLRFDHTYRFPHDRVQEAAYSLVPEAERPALHLRIGRLLLARTPPDALDARLFDIVGQLGRGAALISSPEERARVAELHLAAGARAKCSAAFASALEYFARGVALLPERAWEDRYELTFALELGRAHCEYLTGALESSVEHLAALAARARGPTDLAAVACIQIVAYTQQDRIDNAVDAGLACLREFGIDWSPHPGPELAREEVAAVRRALGAREVEALLDLPPMTDPTLRALIDVLMMLHSPALFSDDDLNCLLIGRTVNLSLAHGNSDASCFAYVWVGMLFGAKFDEHELGFRFGRVGLDLVDEHGLLRFKARVYMCFGALVNPWTRHVRTGVDTVRRAFEFGVESGDIAFASYACNNLITLLLVEGAPLAEVQREIDRALEFVRKARFGLVIDIVTTQAQLVRSLRGLTRALATLDDAHFTEAAFEQHVEGDPRLAIVACWYWIRKTQVRFHAGEHAEAVAAAERAEPLLWTSPSFLELAEHHFFAALARAAMHDAAPDAERPRLRAALEAHDARLRRWAESCPENFRHRAALVAAERARIDGDPERAARCYEEAILAARAGAFVHHEAIACEVASGFYRARGFKLVADAYVREARASYARWGADAKVRQLDRAHPQLAQRTAPGPTATLAVSAEQLDLLSVIKASQTISGAIVREALFETLLRVVLEEGGARRARLALLRGGVLDAPHEIALEELPAPTGESPAFAQMVERYVARTHERVLLDDAARDPGRFAGAATVAASRPRSVLCLPVRRQSDVVAVLYLENDIVAGAFTPERVAVLELLAAQAAISLENALLLEREHAGRVAAEAASRRATLLGEATALVSSSLDTDRTLESLARLCTRSLCDWAVIDLVESGRVVRRAGAHRDPSLHATIRELCERYPARIGTPTPVTAVLQGGASIHVPELADEQIRAFCVDEHHVDLVRALGAGSSLIVPLTVREQPLGALTLGSRAPRRFAPEDVELAEELGRRVALAMDNARLLRETQHALRQREEFLTVASHELRTPLTSLKLAVDALSRVARGDARALSGFALERPLELIARQSRKLQRLIDELLDVARIDQSGLPLQRSAVVLGDLAREVVQQMEIELRSKGSPVTIESPARVVGSWDALRVEQVLTNLVSNAVKFGEGRPIEIRIRQVGDTAELIVEDHGIGIDPARLPYVFNRFERAVPWAHYGGLGIGLYIARSIVIAHGGTIRAESRLGVGTKLVVELPCRPPPSAGVEGSAARPLSRAEGAR
ncbi:AAA family ATPase [Sandaracinus amylolyticus]|uniref:sensor histidine kinase n=1 Tax=Sandaracinus amylolyticus TaxID=927083 RepID=UPI001F479B5E|nr:AAA family ATPase [Sandaracinus amylolyticus]UJR84498.1 Hypothetical protein I5071_65770 [Sandaracinus amylolyticus]